MGFCVETFHLITNNTISYNQYSCSHLLLRVNNVGLTTLVKLWLCSITVQQIYSNLFWEVNVWIVLYLHFCSVSFFLFASSISLSFPLSEEAHASETCRWAWLCRQLQDWQSPRDAIHRLRLHLQYTPCCRQQARARCLLTRNRNTHTHEQWELNKTHDSCFNVFMWGFLSWPSAETWGSSFVLLFLLNLCFPQVRDRLRVLALTHQLPKGWRWSPAVRALFPLGRVHLNPHQANPLLAQGTLLPVFLYDFNKY